jgi:hypothetical protein
VVMCGGKDATTQFQTIARDYTRAIGPTKDWPGKEQSLDFLAKMVEKTL